ncbi:MAG: MYXO-CTERM domain-containing protein [Kiritimatiellia bacterium]|jgi:MYXO-CTERM domain-containing protein
MISLPTIALLLTSGALANPDWRGSEPVDDPSSGALRVATRVLDGLQLRQIDSHPWRGHERRRFVQLLDGVPVWRSDVLVHIDRTGAVRRVRSTVFDVPTPGAPTVSAASARDIAQCKAPPTLWVHPHTGALVWHAVQHSEDHIFDVQVDATSGAILQRTERRLYARGLAYGPDFDGPNEVELHISDGATTLRDGVVKAQSLVWRGDRSSKVSLATADDDGDFYYDPADGLDDPFAEVNAYHHVTSAMSWLEQRFEHPRPSYVEIVSNFRQSADTPYDNAYHQQLGEGRHRLAFGDGTYDHGHDVDTIIHELGHGVVGDIGVINEVPDYPVYHDETGIHLAPGALIEGLPDYLAATYSNDPAMSVTPSGDPLRNLDNDKSCLTWPIGEAHWDAHVVGGLLWSIRQDVGVDPTDQLVYGLIGGLEPDPSFRDIADELLFLAELMVEDGDLTSQDVQTIRDELDSRDMLTCEPYLAVTDSITFSVVGTDIATAGVCALLQAQDVAIAGSYGMAFTVPELDGGTLTSANLDLSWTEPFSDVAVTGEDLKYRVAIQVDERPTFALKRLEFAGLALNYVESVNEPATVIRGNPSSIRLPTAGLLAGQTIYVALVHTNCPITHMTAQVNWDIEPPERGLACGCSTTRSTSWAWLFGAIALVGWRRRRSTRSG